MRHLAIAAIPLVLAVAGCSSSSTSSQSQPGTWTRPTDPTNTVDGNLITLDIAAGTVAAANPSQKPPIAAGSLSFIRIPSGQAILSAGDMVTEAGVSDATTTATVSATFFLSAYELTQAQWKALVTASGSSVPAEPWANVVPAAAFGGTVGDHVAAYGISRDMIQALIAGWNSRNLGAYRLRLPTGQEWEYACRGGGTSTTGRFSWEVPGLTLTQSLESSSATPYAIVSETAGSTLGARIVGSKMPNGLGLYDMHGNLWEWVSDGGTGGAPCLRGGSWADGLTAAMSGNRFTVDQAVPFATAGVRLVLEAR